MKNPEEGSTDKDPKVHWNSGTDQYRELVEELKAVSVESTSSITAEIIAGKLALAVKEGGTKFKDLVNQLKSQQVFNSSTENLNKDNLNTALNEVKEHIKALLKAEFDVTVTNAASQIEVTKDPGASVNKVTVKVKKPGGGGDPENKGSSVVSRNTAIKINDNIEIEVLVDHEDLVTGGGAENAKKDKAREIAQKLASRLSKASEKAKAAGMSSTNYNPGKELVKEEFGISSADVTASGQKVTVTAHEQNGSGKNTESPEKVSVEITGSSGGTEFNNLVDQLATQVKTQASRGSLDATNLKEELNKLDVRNAIQDLVKNEFEVTTVTQPGDITVEKDPGEDNKVIVKIKGGTTVTGTATIKTGSSTEITIEVKGDTSIGITQEKANAIASALALALVNPSVNEALKNKSVTISLKDGSSEVTIQVNNASSNAVARRIARRLAHSLKTNVTGIDMEADTLKNAIGESTKDPYNVKNALARYINLKYWTSITKDDIRAEEDPSAKKKVKVVISGTSGPQEGTSEADVTSDVSGNGVKVTLPDISGKEDENRKKAAEIANRIAGFVSLAALTKQLETTISDKTKLTASDIQSKLNDAKTYLENLVKGYNGAEVNEPNGDGISVETVQNNKVTVTFGKSEKFNTLVTQLKTQVETQLASAPSDANQIATKLNTALNDVKETHIKELAKSMVGGTKADKVNSVDVTNNGNGTVTVKIGSGSTQKGESAEVTFTYTTGGYTATVLIVL